MYTAPFRYTKDATFKNLTVDGTIYAGAQYAGGVVGNSLGNCTFINSHVSVTIDSSVEGEGGHGGFVGFASGDDLDVSRPNFTNCWFDGKLLGGVTSKCGGFLGSISTNAGYFQNCLFAPAELTIGTSGSGTFSATGVYADNITQSYYTTPFGDNHGIRVYTSAPVGEISSKVTAVNQQDYYAPVVISGLRTSYEVSADEMALAYTLTTVDGTALTLNTEPSTTTPPPSLLSLWTITHGPLSSPRQEPST